MNKSIEMGQMFLSCLKELVSSKSDYKDLEIGFFEPVKYGKDFYFSLVEMGTASAVSIKIPISKTDAMCKALAQEYVIGLFKKLEIAIKTPNPENVEPKEPRELHLKAGIYISRYVRMEKAGKVKVHIYHWAPNLMGGMRMKVS